MTTTTTKKMTDEEYLNYFLTADPDSITTNARAVWDSPTFRAIQEARDRKEQAEEDLTCAVRAARSQGMTWQAIGGLLGMSRQGAQSYYASRI